MADHVENIFVHEGDLPADHGLVGDIAVDSETMGLNPLRDRLCVVQLSDGNGTAHLVKFNGPVYDAPNLQKLLADEERVKIFHFGRFDLAVIAHYLDVMPTPVYCTKIVSKLVRTYTDRHGLKDLCQELLNVTLDKQQQSSNWGADSLTAAQQKYAASDVLYLHRLRDALDARLDTEARDHYAAAAFEFLPIRALMDLEGFETMDIFAHS